MVFGGLEGYEERLMDLAENRPVFTGHGQKPSNKQVLRAIDSIKQCNKRRKQSSFFKSSEARPCICGWHANARQKKRSLSATTSSGPAAISPPGPVSLHVR